MVLYRYRQAISATLAAIHILQESKQNNAYVSWYVSRIRRRRMRKQQDL